MANFKNPEESVSIGLLTEIARRYYIDKETQDTIGKSLNLPRMKINRLLKQAQDEGIVEIRIRFHSSETRDLEEIFRDRFGLRHLLVAPDAQSLEQQRTNVAIVVSNFLEANLRENAVVAVGMGRNVARVAKVNANRTFESITFVAGSGGATEAAEEGNADHIARNLAMRFGGNSETLYAPAFVPDAVLRQSLMQNETVRRTLNLARSANFALIGIGDLAPDSHMARMGWFSLPELKQAQAAGVVGDLMGYDFFNRDGVSCNNELGERGIGLTISDLRQINQTIAIASEPSKATAILGALKTGAINTLATTLSNCLAISELIKDG
jgi:DNA-binding transcriptional regulator LsrR (DeoR family)